MWSRLSAAAEGLVAEAGGVDARGAEQREDGAVPDPAGAGGVEFFQPAQNGKIIPLGQTRAAMNGGQQSISGTITISLSEDIDGRIVSVAGPLSVQIVREASGPLIEASANEALRRAGRPKL